jgi:small subunit ribosomal protein S6
VRKEYELVIILNAKISDEKSKTILEKYEAQILADNGDLIIKNDWGVKKLSHSIKGHFKGHYYFFDFLASPDHIAEAERLMRYDEDILRYMLIKIGEDIDVDTRKSELAKIEALAAAKKQQQTENFRER